METSRYLSESINPLLKEIFPEDKFVLLSQTYDEAHFGNAFIKYAHKSFRIQVARDRGQLFVEIAPRDNSNNWYWLPRLFEYLNLANELDFIEHNLLCVRKQLEFLSHRIDQVTKVFENFSVTKLDLDKFQQKKGDEFVQKLMKRNNVN